MGLSLNQRGLFENVIRDPKTGLKTADGIRLPLNTEEAIFERLGVRWRELEADADPRRSPGGADLPLRVLLTRPAVLPPSAYLAHTAASRTGDLPAFVRAVYLV